MPKQERLAMTRFRRLAGAGLLSLIVLHADVGSARGADTAKRDAAAAGPILTNICLITDDVKRLTKFYEVILATQASWSGPDYAELTTGSSILAIFSFEAQQKYIPDVTEAASNKSMILEFRVSDPDREYGRLQGIVTSWVKPPTTQPWGTRSIYFRDPDGNLVNFFTRIKKQ